ncbi:glycoside hydrolase family 2 TIM barrel-domain containing protein [Polaribacter butkevichii]|nr:glycoside hydrolase family 2 TIM barrel-domain containing protein [Polaribacter butkevichii]
MCDKYGFYVVDEANIESHDLVATNQGLDKNKKAQKIHPAYQPEWKAAHMDRTIRIFERDKNYPSIVTWSLGNEAGNGDNFFATYKYLKDQDSTRPTQYEGVLNYTNTDIQAPMYWIIDRMIKYAENNPKRPLIQCGYAHAVGNSVGGLQDYWGVFPTFSKIAGVDVPKNIDGISFLPELLGNKKDQKEHEYLYWEFHEKGGRQAVRKGNWKAVKYNVLKTPNKLMELYDLDNDLGEKNNVAKLYPEVVKEMEVIFKEARTPSDVFTFSQETFLNVD